MNIAASHLYDRNYEHNNQFVNNNTIKLGNYNARLKFHTLQKASKNIGKCNIIVIPFLLPCYSMKSLPQIQHATAGELRH